jgi:ABC-type lipoprotein export system ATPase subunit
VVLVTHSREAAGAAGRTIELRDGRIVADEPARA